MQYDLEERTAKFAENIIDFLRPIERNLINTNIISQLIRSTTSIRANYMEANQGSSNKDFKNKIYICRKESNETKYWLRILAKANPELIEKSRKFWKEAHELTLIFASITKKC